MNEEIPKIGTRFSIDHTKVAKLEAQTEGAKTAKEEIRRCAVVGMDFKIVKRLNNELYVINTWTGNHGPWKMHKKTIAYVRRMQ